MKDIIYKVVDENRNSILAAGKFEIHYKKGKIIKALSYTCGAMGFERLKDAKAFAENKGDIVIKLRPLSEKIKPFGFFVRDLEEASNKYCFLQILNRDKYEIWNRFPDGTICCRLVKVLT